MPSIPGRYDYSILAWLVLVVTIGPAFWAWFAADTLENYPNWLCLGIGIAISFAFFSIRAHRQKNREKAVMDQFFPEVDSSRLDDEELRSQIQQRLAVVRPVDKTGLRTMALSILVYAPPCWMLALGLGANRWLDRSPVTDHAVVLIEFKRPLKSQPVARLTSWRNRDEVETAFYNTTVHFEIYPDAPPHSPVFVSTRKGAFGWEYITGIRPRLASITDP